MVAGAVPPAPTFALQGPIRSSRPFRLQPP
jgi:hypothetical protein